MQIGKYLTLDQACKSQTALNLGVKNSPSQNEIKNIVYLYQKVYEPLCEHFGVRLYFTNWFRSKALNSKIKGASPTSFHLTGGAVDIDMDGSKIKNIDIFNYIKNNLPFTELILEHPDKDGNPAWVHVAILPGRENEKAIKTIRK